jgi:hypothetical protein
MTSLTLTGTEHFSGNKKANSSVNKLQKKYRFVLELQRPAQHAATELVEWQNKGAGRDWYEGTWLGLKIYKQGPNYTDNTSEWRIWRENEVVRENTPRCYGQFEVSAPDHNETHVMLDVLVQDKCGLSLGNRLKELCTDQGSWNHATAMQVVKLWSNTLRLADSLTKCGLTWASDFHVGNACMSLCGERMLWVDWACCLADHTGPVAQIKTALQKLAKLLPHYVTFQRDWQLWHNSLFTKLKAALSKATAQNYVGWWCSTMTEVFPTHGLPLVVPHCLNETNTRSEEESVIVGTTARPLHAETNPSDTSSEKDAETFCPSTRTEEESVSVGTTDRRLPAEPNPSDTPSEKDAETFGPKKARYYHPARCWAALKEGDGILIQSLGFWSLFTRPGKELADDDGIIGQVLSISACTCAGRDITLHGVA